MKNERLTPTVNYMVYQSCKNFNNPLTFRQNTTLNEMAKINIFPGEVADINAINMGYFCVGNGAAKSFTTGSGAGSTLPYKFSPLSSGLFNMVPLVMRTLDNDLTASERANFALVVDQTYSGTVYRCYYLSKITRTDDTININIYERTGKEETTTPFVSKASNLNPTPTTTFTPSDETSNSTNTENSQDVWVEKPVSILFTEWLIAEYKNAIKIIYGTSEHAIINEIGLVIAGTKVRQLKNAVGTSFNFNEALHAQIAVFVNMSLNFTLDGNSAEYKFDIGISEPLPAGTIVGDNSEAG